MMRDYSSEALCREPKIGIISPFYDDSQSFLYFYLKQVKRLMWWLLLVILIIVHVTRVEYRSQDNRRYQCANTTPRAHKTDEYEEMIDKTIYTMRRNHSIVSWRRAIVISLLLAFPIVYFLTGQVQNGFKYVGVVFLIALFIYFSHVFVEHNLWFKNGLKIEDELLQLRNKLNN